MSWRKAAKWKRYCARNDAVCAGAIMEEARFEGAFSYGFDIQEGDRFPHTLFDNAESVVASDPH